MVPGVHDSQAVPAGFGAVLPVHGTHDLELLEKASPGEHITQSLWCAFGFCPLGHESHEIPSRVICPDGHAVHVVCPAVEVSPGGQDTHELAAVFSKVPAEHAVH